MNDNKITFLNINDNIFYKVYNIIFSYKDAPIILYLCNIDDSFIIVQTSSYMDYKYIIYINNKEIINITKSTDCGDYYLPEISESLKEINNKIIPIKKKLKKYLFFGFNLNTDHYLWNEISGLYYFLKNNKYHNKIDGIIIGPFDSCSIIYKSMIIFLISSTTKLYNSVKLIL